MILFELTGSEDNPAYQKLAISNGERHYGFLQSVVAASTEVDRPFLSQNIIKALNYHAMACLHTNSGEFRPCEVTVGVYEPPAQHRVQALMDDFVNHVNRHWEKSDPVELAAFVLWKLNHIHPFINGNGRTARAASYFVLCLKLGGWLDGEVILPELLKRNRAEYVKALQTVDATLSTKFDLTALNELIAKLLTEQLGE